MKYIYGRAQSLVQSGVDLILPPRCSLTGDIVDAQGMLSARAWGGLHFVSDPYCAHCGVPFEFESGSTCLDCMDHTPPFSMARAALVYNDTSRDLILGFKHGDKTHVVRSFVPWLKKAGAPMWWAADYLILWRVVCGGWCGAFASRNAAYSRHRQPRTSKHRGARQKRAQSL